uniref:non-specific protein-tyrosine kinase n=1 Tax=Hucho hucho TaxID=62062 RepID=A0A4W5JP44_9TELE
MGEMAEYQRLSSDDEEKLGSNMQSEEGTEWLLELLMEVQLQQYFLRIRDDLNVTRLSHFDYVKNEDLEKIGMGRPGEFYCGGGVCVCSAHSCCAFLVQVHLCTLCLCI